MNEPKAIGQVINIGNTEEVTMTALAERVRALTGSHSPIRLVPYDEAYESGFEDMPRRLPDLSKIQAMIGYRPRFSLDDILRSRHRVLSLSVAVYWGNARQKARLRLFVVCLGAAVVARPAAAEVQSR